LDQVKASLSQLPDEIRSKIPDKLTFYKGAGCDKCKQIGYKNRLGIYEVIDITPGIQKLLLQPGITDAEIEEAAVKEGSVLLRQDGILKALDGETTLEEVLRVTE
jgi:type II secretory ATPase GspE/PulE/Tfp pilus assembly ATPase PilB-like protein